jgi:hypothetical protein
LLEHCVQMGDAIWLFLWLIDATTRESANEKGDVAGKVLGGMPVSPRRIAEALGGVSEKTIGRWRKKLIEGGYISAKNTGRGFVYTVLKSKKKWKSSEEGHESPSSSDKNVQPAPTKMSNLVSRDGQAGCPQRESSLPENGILYRQSSDKTETKQKNETEISAASVDFESLKKKIWKSHRQLGSKLSPIWRRAEDRALQELMDGGHKPRTIFYAHRHYIERADEWEKKNNYPFCAFAQKFQQYIDTERDDEGNPAEDDRPPTYVPPKLK